MISESAQILPSSIRCSKRRADRNAARHHFKIMFDIMLECRSPWSRNHVRHGLNSASFINPSAGSSIETSMVRSLCREEVPVKRIWKRGLPEVIRNPCPRWCRPFIGRNCGPTDSARDDDASASQLVTNPVPDPGYFNRTLLGYSSRAPGAMNNMCRMHT